MLLQSRFCSLGLENLEFSLSIKIRKDPHVVARQRNLVPKPLPASLAPPPPSSPSSPFKKESGFRKLLSSPRKPKPAPAPTTVPQLRPVEREREPLKDDLVRYLATDGTLATVKVVFKTIAAKCNGQILTLGLPLSGRWNEESLALASRDSSEVATVGKRQRVIGRMELQLIMVPSLPGLSLEQMPQSLDEAVTGLRHVHWHKMDYFSGVLTQLGGDCSVSPMIDWMVSHSSWTLATYALHCLSCFY